MNQEELKKFKQLMILTAEYLQTTISKPQLEMYSKDLCHLDFNYASEALIKIRRETKDNFNKFPLPAVIIEECLRIREKKIMIDFLNSDYSK